MKSSDIRRRFLDYFEKRQHKVLSSSPVIPHGDPSLLFTNAGMVQFKDIFIGRQKAPHPRAATVQKCLRAGGKHNDLDNVGYTARHLTFFEMLGNFSFGDYFKKEAVQFAWEFLTTVFRLDPARLWVTVYREDDEARSIWRSDIRVPEERIIGLGEKDNYWSMGDVGPCGPCSEILIDRGEQYACGPACGIGSCDCDRFFEVWNLVFMQFNQGADGRKVPLARPSIDTGMGLERAAMILQGVDSVFDTDVLRTIIARIEELTGTPYRPGPESIPHRVIADHIRALVFAFADGAEPSNEGRGYVLRRILRRAARYGRKIHAGGEPLLSRLVDRVIENLGAAYPEIGERRRHIEGVIRSEEERFGRTLDQGIGLFEQVASRLRERGEKTIPGEEAFQLYDTFGFPVDLVQQMAAEVGFEVDLEGYERAMAAQKDRSRKESQFAAEVRSSGGEEIEVERFPETRFLGYRQGACEAELMGVARAGELWTLVLAETPFYAESGGQVGDTGRLEGEGFVLEVEDTQKRLGRWMHLARLLEGDPARIRPGSGVKAAIDAARRLSIERNHTATHLLHAALRQVIGTHVHQKGSLVEAARLRFDVTHSSGITPEEQDRVEELVLSQIARNLPIETFETDYRDAIGQGAMALFGEKYGDRVRVVRIGGFSIELCGGTHVERCGDIGAFAISQEASVSAGVRRLEALTEAEAGRYHLRHARLVKELSLLLKVPPEQLPGRIERMQEEIRKLRSAGGSRAAASAGSSADAAVRRERLGKGEGAPELCSGIVEGAGMNEVLAIHDRLKAGARRGISILFGRRDGKLQVLVAIAPELIASGWDARQIFAAGQALIDGRGGGRAEMVRGGGTNAAAAEAGLDAMCAFARSRAGGE